jgi:hypothetical protein
MWGDRLTRQINRALNRRSTRGNDGTSRTWHVYLSVLGLSKETPRFIMWIRSWEMKRQLPCFYSIFLRHILQLGQRKTTEPITPKLYKQISYITRKCVLRTPTPPSTILHPCQWKWWGKNNCLHHESNQPIQNRLISHTWHYNLWF